MPRKAVNIMWEIQTVLKIISKSIHTKAPLTRYKLPIIYKIKDNLRHQLSMCNNCYVTFYTPQLNNCTNISSDGSAASVTLAMKWLC